MPRETVAFVIVLGLGLGALWGALSLLLWSADESVPGVIILPLWLVAVIGPHVKVDVQFLGAAVCAALGVLAASAALVVARARGA